MAERGGDGAGVTQRRLPRTVGQVVALVLVLGASSILLLAVWVTSPWLTMPKGLPDDFFGYRWWYALAGVFVVLAAAGELISVRIWRGSTSEDLTFLEAVLVAAVLTMPPMVTIAAVLTGLVAASIIQRRDLSKTLFNVGSYATSTALMILIYYTLDGGADRFGWRSVLALLLATLAFSLINTYLLSLVFHVVADSDPREYFADEWRLSGTMAVGGVGIGTTAVFLASESTWALLPFVALPALAMWYAYGAAAQHVEARERNKWLVRLGGLLAQHGQGTTTLDESAEAIRQIVGAPEMMVLQPGASPDDLRTERILSSTWAEQGPRPLAAEELPDGWQTGFVTRLDMGTANPGALLIGSTDEYRRSRIAGRTRGWSLDEADAPVLGALVAAVGSAMRAGAAFNALSEETAKLTAVIDNTSDGIAMVDEAGQVRLWSQTMARMTGVEADQIPSQIEGAPAIVQTLVGASKTVKNRSDGTPAPVRARLVRADGEELEVTISTVRVREAATSSQSDTTGWVSILTVHDETRERRVERMKADFVATISHELRTPITPIKGYAHLMATRGDRIPLEKRTLWAQVISGRADHMARLVDDLLIASKVSDGTRLAIEMGVEDLEALIRRAVSSFPQMAERFTVELPEEPIAVQCDLIRAEQCLSNLLSNAEKYTPADSPIHIRAEVTERLVHIHVRDRGPGIPVSEQARVFDRFYRREDPFTMRTGGAGLGLHIARELAVAMGGGLTLNTPAAGPGAEFVLHLVTAQAPRVTVAQAAQPTHDGGSDLQGASPQDSAETTDTPAGAEPSDSGQSPAGDDRMDPPRGSHLAAM